MASGGPRPLLPVLTAVCLLTGVVLAVLGTLHATTWAPSDTLTAQVTLTDPGPVVVTEPGLAELASPVTVEVSSEDDGPVLIAVGRDTDVEAWVGAAAHTRLTDRAEDGTLVAEKVDGEPTVPDPATSDLWVEQVDGQGSVELTEAARPGRWQLLIATDGQSSQPLEVRMSWPYQATSQAPLLLGLAAGWLSVGALLLVLVLRRRVRAVPQDRRPATGAIPVVRARDDGAAPGGATEARAAVADEAADHDTELPTTGEDR